MIDEQIETLRVEVDALQAAKGRIIRLHENLLRHNRRKRQRARELAAMLERGDETCRSYISWTEEQFSERPEHLVRR